jgi:hypothetical protein
MIESGYMQPMLKDPRFFRFVAWAAVPLDDRPEGAVSILILIHQDCFMSSRGELEDELAAPEARDSRHCDLCRRRFDPYHKMFQVTEWCPMPEASDENGQPEFVLDPTVEKILLCPGCMKRILGEGDEEEGDAYLTEGILPTTKEEDNDATEPCSTGGDSGQLRRRDPESRRARFKRLFIPS